MTLLEILFAVRGLVDTPEKWFKGGLARNGEGRKVSITHPRACQFSLDGAFYRVSWITKAKCGPAYNHLKRVLDPHLVVSVANWQDAEGVTHWSMLQKLDEAIRQAGGTPPTFEEE